MADKTTVQITEDNIDELNIKVGTILKDNEGLYWKITDFNDFTAGMKVCDKNGNEIENFVGNAERAIFGGGLSDLLNDGVATYFIETEQEQPEIKKDVRYNYFVKDTSEFEQFADFEPITNLTAEEAVRTLIELNIKKGLSAGIGINIPDDFIFDDPDGNGAIIFMKTNDEYSFYMGDNFVKELKENNEHAQNVIAAFKELDNAIKTSVLGDIEVYKKPDFLYTKEKELFGDKNMEKKEIQITPVSLEEILSVMEMKPEVTPEGRIKIFDQQRGEYIPTWVGQGDGDLGFEHATEIFERLDIYINDYFIHDMEEQLEAGGVTLRGDETLKDLCDYTKEQLEAGITTVSQGELNLAMGIVNPDTVIMPESFLERTETTTFTLKNTTSEQIAELKEHLSMNGYDVSWKEKSKDSTDIQFSANFDEESWISTILDDRNLTYTRSYEHSAEQKQIKENVNKNIEIIQSARNAKWKNEKGEELVIFVQKQPDGKDMLAFGKSENYENPLGKYDNSDGSFTLLSEYTHSLYWSFCYPDQTGSLTQEEQKIFNDVMEKYNPDFKKSVSENVITEKEKILEQCNKIIENFTNTHFTEQEQKLVNEYEKEESNRHQALMSLCNMKYIHCTTKDKDGYWEINKGKEITANEARKLMTYDDFVSGVDRASFHITAGRTANDGSFIYFNDSEQKRDIQPYEFTKVDIELLSKYEEAGGLKENLPKSVLEQLSKNNNELTADDLKNARALLPKEQYQVVLGYTQGEEGEHFKGIIKEISSKAEAIKGKREILTEDEKHPLTFKYIMGASSFYFSEWNGGDELFGYVVLNGNTQDSEWGYTSLEELKNSGSKDRNGFPIMPEMIFYGLEDTIEKQISVDYPELSEQMGFKPKLNHNEELISEFGKEIFETLHSRKLEQSAYNICCAAQFVIRTMDSSEQKEIFSIMKKCGCEGKNGRANTEDFLTEVVRAENNTASSVYDRKRLYEKINKACSSKKPKAGKNIHNQESDYDMEI